jgi:prepilin-type N-terminal cleavage/methylation domain-containing protein/prepilin-type processing-associated H-X9-DG protein
MRNKFCGFTPTPICIVATRLKETSKTALAGFQNAQSKYKLVWGFTLVEILVVMAIIAALLSLFLAALGRSRQAAYRIACLNNLKQLGVAVEAYAQSYGFYPVCVPPDVNEKWSDFLADKTIATGKELGVPVSLWPFHQTTALYNCPILSRAGCDISYCYNYLAGAKISMIKTAAVVPSYIPTPKEFEYSYHLLRPEEVKSPVRFILLYDLPMKSDVVIGPDSNDLCDLYHDIDPDDYQEIETLAPVTNPGPGYLRYNSGPHSQGYDILFAGGHVKWYKRWSDSEMSRNPQ